MVGNVGGVVVSVIASLRSLKTSDSVAGALSLVGLSLQLPRTASRSRTGLLLSMTTTMVTLVFAVLPCAAASRLLSRRIVRRRSPLWPGAWCYVYPRPKEDPRDTA